MSQFNVHKWNKERRLAALNEAEVDASGNLVGFGGGDWKSKVNSYDHIHFFIEPQNANLLMDKLIMAGIDMVDSYPYKGAHLLRVSLGDNAAADLVKAEKIIGQSAKKGSPEDLGEVDLGRQGAVEIAREGALHDLQDAIDKASQLGAVNGLEKAALDTILVNAIKRRARDRGDI